MECCHKYFVTGGMLPITACAFRSKPSGSKGAMRALYPFLYTWNVRARSTMNTQDNGYMIERNNTTARQRRCRPTPTHTKFQTKRACDDALLHDYRCAGWSKKSEALSALFVCPCYLPRINGRVSIEPNCGQPTGL